MGTGRAGGRRAEGPRPGFRLTGRGQREPADVTPGGAQLPGLSGGPASGGAGAPAVTAGGGQGEGQVTAGGDVPQSRDRPECGRDKGRAWPRAGSVAAGAGRPGRSRVTQASFLQTGPCRQRVCGPA